MTLTLNPKALFVLFIFVLPNFAYGDGFTRGVFQLSKAETEQQYEFIAEYPVSKDSSKPIIFPSACRPSQSNQYRSNDLVIKTYLLDCELALKSGDTITVPYSVDAAIFELQLGAWQSRTIADKTQAGFELVLQADDSVPKTLLNIAEKYSYQGIIHIWFGWDHLAFVFCLCLLAANFRNLIWTITAFTMGHSISMALSFFSIVNISIPPIEAIIALSIVLVAREAWFKASHTAQISKPERLNMLVVVTLFGLIHGLGFASALQNIGVADDEQIPALIFFNLGVELGQVTFVILVSAIIRLLSKVEKQQIFARMALVCVGSAGSFWTIQRISSFNW
jgi:hydrogenase/urease accessory protein HupE